MTSAQFYGSLVLCKWSLACVQTFAIFGEVVNQVSHMTGFRTCFWSVLFKSKNQQEVITIFASTFRAPNNVFLLRLEC